MKFAILAAMLLAGICRAEEWTRPPWPDVLRDEAAPPDFDAQPKPRQADAAGNPEGRVAWRPGDFARYVVIESVAVPGTRPFPDKEGRPVLQLLPQRGAVTMTVLGREGDGWWLEARVERPGFWFAMPPVDAEAKTQWSRWIARPRRAALRLFVEGPALGEVRRYQVTIDGAEWIEFRRPDGMALLPNNDYWDLFVKPIAEAKGESPEGWALHAGVPVTGVLRGESRDSFRERRFVLVESGAGPAVAVEPPGHLVTIDPGLIVGTLVPRKVEKWDIANFTARLGDEDFKRIPALIEAGFNWFEPAWHVHHKDLGKRSALAVEFRAAMARAPAFWAQPTSCEIDEFDRLRSNFLGGYGILDEPMAYFSPRTKKGDGTPLSAADLLGRYQEFVRGYGRSDPWGADSWKRPIISANYPAGVAACDAEATPLIGFALEIFGKSQLQPLHELNRRAGTSIPLTQANAVSLDAAFLRGAASVHGMIWGACLYQGTWMGERASLVNALRAQGAGLFLLWSFHDDAPLEDDEAMTLARAIRAHRGAPPKPEVALVLPRGFYIPAGLWAPSGPKPVDEEFGFWKDPVSREDLDRALGPFGRGAERLLKNGTAFDVVPDGPGTERALGKYRDVKKFR
ncbi:MAG: hypothetical protein HYY18_00585 [Planctomycetes bacterium]|nr:hypothetical protein [Planctomycetota bacterium]